MKLSSLLSALALSVGITAAIPSAVAAVWTTANAWSAEWEASYQDWLRAHGKTDMFSRKTLEDGTPNPYYGLRVDCADLVYTLRALFAFENQLPFAIANPVNPRRDPISNEIARYDSTPEGAPRFIKFMNWLFDLVSTNGLWRDTYSIPFSAIGPGSIILTSKKNHHSWTIIDVSQTGNPTLLFNSTVGRESGLRVQQRKSWPNPHWVFEPEVDETDPTVTKPVYRVGSYAGFRYWRPIEHLKTPEQDVPGYSAQQFLVGIGKWKSRAKAALASVNETVDQIVHRLLQDACADFKQRFDAVTEAETFKKLLATDLADGKTPEESDYVREWLSDPDRPSDSRCLTASRFDSLSTPSRDRRLLDGLMLARAYYSYGLKRFGKNGFSKENLRLYSKFFPMPELSAAAETAAATTEVSSSYCVQKIPGIDTLSLARFKSRLFRGVYSSNPNDSWPGRFGFPRDYSDLGESCPAYDYSHSRPDLDAIEKDAAQEVNDSPVEGISSR